MASVTSLLITTGGTANAAATDDTATTFAVDAATLDIVVPATAALGAGTPGTVISGALGPVTVTDGRASADASWVASVQTTDFVSPPTTVPATAVNYWSGPATATAGDGTFTPGQPTVTGAVPIDALATAFTHAGGTGNNSATWNPTVMINVPLSAPAGDYSGTVTHSVA